MRSARTGNAGAAGLERVVFTVGFAVFAVMAAEGITWMDPGQLVAAAHALGGAHPPGHPAHSLLGKLASLVPIGEIAFRVALLSALAAALALVGVVALARALVTPGGSRAETEAEAAPVTAPVEVAIAAAVAAALCALSPVVQTNAVRAEVYAPAAALIVWALVAAVRFVRGSRPGDGPGADGRLALLAVLALAGAAAFHPVIAASAAAPIAGALAWHARGRLTRLWPLAAGACALGLALYAYLPVRAAAADPPLLMWGDPRDLAALLDVMSARAYRGNLGADGVVERLAALFVLAGDGIGAGLVLGGLVGLGFGALTGLRGAWLPLACALCVLVGTAAQSAVNPDLAGYVLPALLALAAGLAPLVSAVVRLLPAGLLPSAPSALASGWRTASRAGVAAAVLLPVALIGVAAPSARVRDAGFQRGDAPLALWDDTLARMPPGPGVYFAAGDHTLFAFQYERLVAGGRPDIAIAHPELCRDAWFVRHLDRALPALYVPFVDDGVRGDIAERLAAGNLHAGRPVGGDRPVVGRLDSLAAVPMGRAFRFGPAADTSPDGAAPAPAPPAYPGDTGARVARLVGLTRARYEADRGRLADAARAAGLDATAPRRFDDDDMAALAASTASANPARPSLIEHIPLISYVFISEAWQPALVADDLSWRATLDDPALSEESIIPERQLHAAWRRLLVALPSPEPSSPGSGFADAALRTARSDARRAIGRDAALATARMLVAVDRPAAAEALLEAAIEVDPAEQVLVLLGSLIGNRGTPEALDRAAALFLRAAERAPGSAEPWVRLGVTRAKQGRAADARDAWQRALAIDPARRDAAEFLRRLRAE